MGEYNQGLGREWGSGGWAGSIIKGWGSNWEWGSIIRGWGGSGVVQSRVGGAGVPARVEDGDQVVLQLENP